MSPHEEPNDDRLDAPFEIVASGVALQGEHGALALRLGACLNRIRALQRWFGLLHESEEHACLVARDKIHVYIAMCGCLKETLDVIGSTPSDETAVLDWLKRHSDKTDDIARRLCGLLEGRRRAFKGEEQSLYTELRRVRNKIDAHVDPDVFTAFAQANCSRDWLVWAKGPTSRQAHFVCTIADDVMRNHLAAGHVGATAEEYLAARVRECGEAMTLLGYALEYALGSFLQSQGAERRNPAT